jgi:hypothetical protein
VGREPVWTLCRRETTIHRSELICVFPGRISGVPAPRDQLSDLPSHKHAKILCHSRPLPDRQQAAVPPEIYLNWSLLRLTTHVQRFYTLCYPVRFVLSRRLCLRPCGTRGSRNWDHCCRLLSPRDSVLIIDHFPSVRTLLKPRNAAYVGLQQNLLSLHSVPKDMTSLFWKQEITAAVSVSGFAFQNFGFHR